MAAGHNVPVLQRWAFGAAAFWRLSRFNNVVLPALTVATGYYLYPQHDAGRELLLTSIIAYTLLHAVITIWNDVCDDHVDKLNGTPRIQQVKDDGHWRTVVTLCTVSLLLALCCMFWLPCRITIGLVIFLVLGWAYNTRPLLLSHKPIASQLVLALAYGAIPAFIGVSHDLSLTSLVLIVSLMLGRSSLSLLKDYKDAIGDSKATKKTFLLVYGGALTARLSVALAVIGYIGVTAIVTAHTGNYSTAAMLSMALVGIWLTAQRTELFRRHSYTSLNIIFHHCLRYEMLFIGLAALWSYLSYIS